MAVDSKKVPVDIPKTFLIRDYWPRYKKFAVLSIISIQLTITIIVACSLIVGGVLVNSVTFWITIMSTALVTTSLNTMLILQLLTPHRDLANSISSAAGEKPRYALANPNLPRYVKNGFHSLLQFIYEGAAAKNQPVKETSSEPNAKITQALAQTKAGLVIMDAKGTITYANTAAPIRVTADGQQELELLFDPETSFTDWLKKCRQTAVHAEQTWYRVANRITGADDRRIFNVTANYEKGSAAEVVLVMYDETDVYKADDEDLDFIAFAAHELRGPITVIRGYLDVLDIEMGDQMSPDQKELMQRLMVSANRLSGYINNILNTNKYDRRHLQIHLAEDTVSNIYDMVRDDMALRASSQHRLLAIDIPDDLPTIAADRSSLSEVFANLIDNALKYSNEGGSVALAARVDGSFVKISVTDNGIGIPANVVGNLFHKFYRSHRSRETVAGTGIGLYICKAIVESHGGSIEVSSTEGQGSIFSFTVPIYASVADKLQANDHTNAGLISTSEGWIKNHAKYKS